MPTPSDISPEIIARFRAFLQDRGHVAAWSDHVLWLAQSLVERLRYPGQPRDAHGRFGEGKSDATKAKEESRKQRIAAKTAAKKEHDEKKQHAAAAEKEADRAGTHKAHDAAARAHLAAADAALRAGRPAQAEAHSQAAARHAAKVDEISKRKAVLARIDPKGISAKADPKVKPLLAKYTAATRAVIGQMPAAAVARLHGGLSAVIYRHSVESITKLAVKSSPAAREAIAKNPRQQIAGWYRRSLGMAILDGDSPKNPEATIHGTHAHELTHAIDGPRHEISETQGWKRAWEAEIAPGPKLSRYAQEKPSEGFAEFGRHLYTPDRGDGERAARLQWVKETFPRSWDVFKVNGLLPDDAEGKQRGKAS